MHLGSSCIHIANMSHVELDKQEQIKEVEDMGHHQIVIVGGGTAGITVAARLLRANKSLDVAIIEPSETHYYQPIWTLVGAGDSSKEGSARPMASVIPSKAKWIKDKVESFSPDENKVHLQQGGVLGYDQLVVCPGIQIDWHLVPGLKETVGRQNVTSNYSYETVGYTWEAMKKFQGGTAIFTQPNTPFKCGGAPQKIMYLADDAWIKTGVREKTEIIWILPGKRVFGVDKYCKSLEKVVERKEIQPMFGHHLIAIDPEKSEITVENVETLEQKTLSYDFIHVTPPMSSPEFCRSSPLSNLDNLEIPCADTVPLSRSRLGGWVTVDSKTLQHTQFKNIWALGDVANLPTAKTGAGVRKQAPVVVGNMLASMAGNELKWTYDGYSSCPLVTGYGKLIMAEFDYDKQPVESFPFDQGKERYSMYVVKKHLLPLMYWKFMLKGKA